VKFVVPLGILRRDSVARMDRPTSLSVLVERWPIAGSFAISRGAKSATFIEKDFRL
jgi:hypothetical protein